MTATEVTASSFIREYTPLPRVVIKSPCALHDTPTILVFLLVSFISSFTSSLFLSKPTKCVLVDYLNNGYHIILSVYIFISVLSHLVTLCIILLTLMSAVVNLLFWPFCQGPAFTSKDKNKYCTWSRVRLPLLMLKNWYGV